MFLEKHCRARYLFRLDNRHVIPEIRVLVRVGRFVERVDPFVLFFFPPFAQRLFKARCGLCKGWCWLAGGCHASTPFDYRTICSGCVRMSNTLVHTSGGSLELDL